MTGFSEKDGELRGWVDALQRVFQPPINHAAVEGFLFHIAALLQQRQEAATKQERDELDRDIRSCLDSLERTAPAYATDTIRAWRNGQRL